MIICERCLITNYLQCWRISVEEMRRKGPMLVLLQLLTFGLLLRISLLFICLISRRSNSFGSSLYALRPSLDSSGKDGTGNNLHNEPAYVPSLERIAGYAGREKSRGFVAPHYYSTTAHKLH